MEQDILSGAKLPVTAEEADAMRVVMEVMERLAEIGGDEMAGIDSMLVIGSLTAVLAYNED